MKGTWAIVLVRKYMALECTSKLLKTSRTYIGKNGYSFEQEFICEDHVDFSLSCKDCVTKTVTYTDEDMFNRAVDMAQMQCSLRDDTWVVDSDTLQIVAAFRMSIEKFV